MSAFDLASLGPERLVSIDGAIDPGPLPVRAVLRLGEREWLVLDAVAAEIPELAGALAVDVGDSIDGWRLSGPGACELMAKACLLDLGRLPAGAATRTVMGGVTVLVRVVAADVFELRVERSYAAWFEAWLRQL